MEELRTYIVMVIGAVLSLLAPIQNFMYAMLLLFGVNFIFGVLAARAQGEDWETKKALKFIWYCVVFFVGACAVFIIGHLMGEKQQAVAVVKILCYVAIYIFGTNILRNWMNFVPEGSTWYKMADLLYYILSVKFTEKFDFIKKAKKEQESTGRTILDKDDN